MTYLGYPLTIEDAFRRRSVELEGDAHIRTQVCAEGLDAEAFAGPSDNSIEFRLCRALRYDRLGLGPGLYAVLADADAAARCAFARPAAPGPVGVGPHDDLGLSALHWKPPNEPRVVLEEPAYPH